MSNEDNKPLDTQDNIQSTLNVGMNAFHELRKQAQKNGLQDMSLEEINEEIKKTRYGK
jgi:hypothetical protein